MQGGREVAGFPLPAGILLGLGLGGFFDGIILHQVLQWHHMLTSAGYPADTVPNLELNVFWDGIFHMSTYVFTALGLYILWRYSRRNHVRWSGKLLPGATRERCRDQRLSDSGEHDLAVLEQSARRYRHDLVGPRVESLLCFLATLAHGGHRGNIPFASVVSFFSRSCCTDAMKESWSGCATRASTYSRAPSDPAARTPSMYSRKASSSAR